MANSPFAGDGTVPRHRFGRHLEIWVGAVEEGLAALRHGLEDERGGGGAPLQGWPGTPRTGSRSSAILHIEAGTIEAKINLCTKNNAPGLSAPLSTGISALLKDISLHNKKVFIKLFTYGQITISLVIKQSR